MNFSKSCLRTCLLVFVLVLTIPETQAQTKKIKRPKSRVSISSVDRFVQESFDLYDKVYKYDGYAEAGTPLDDDDIDVLEEALTEMTALSESAPNILSDLDGVGVLKQGKATLQINKAKKALKYSIKTTKELLLGQREREKNEEKNPEPNQESTSTNDSGEDNNPSSNENTNDPKDSNISDNLKINSKFDFVPGDKLLFFDDFSNDFIGDFPSKWNTNGSGEIVTFNNSPEKWFNLKTGYGVEFIPDLLNGLPENYTIEFDLLVTGVDDQTSSNSRLEIKLEDTNTFKTGNNYALVRIPFCQYVVTSFDMRNKINNQNTIQSSTKADIRKAVLNKPHISIAVNKQRFRVWVNQNKHVDIPRMIGTDSPMKAIKFSINGFKDGKEDLFIKNLKIAKGGVDLRRKLMSEGKISTNGILFDSGSDKIQPQSYGIIRQISQVLMQDTTIKLNIIGHTDADGSDDANLKLSKARAEAVKNALISVYNIPANRLQSDGKGETMPVGDNNTTEGKAQNRRVEFVKI